MNVTTRRGSHRRTIRGVLTLATALAVAPLASTVPSAAAEADPWARSAVLADDEFSRTVPAGLGAAPTGAEYTVNNPALYRVVDGRAQLGPVQPGVATSTLLGSVTAVDVEVTAELILPEVGNGSFRTYEGVQLRSADGSAYRARLVVSDGGRSALSIERVNGSSSAYIAHVQVPTAVQPGHKTFLSARVTGTSPVTVEARAWPEGAAVPDWQARVTDSSAERIARPGAVGLWKYTGKGSSAVTSELDRFTAWSLTTSPESPAPSPEPAPDPEPAPVPAPEPAPVPVPAPQPAPEPAPQPVPDPEPAPAPAPEVDSTFSLAVIPDTQQDVFGSDRLTNRAQWLVANRDALDLEFVLHTGDVVNWDTAQHEQYANASASLKILDDAKVPTTLAIGNHDTYAVGEGGSARDPRLTTQYVRDTRTFNSYFSTTRYQVEGTFEPGKIDNNYQLFTAGGEDWMILTLELWPRPEAVEWGKQVVAAHPGHNVIVMTHSYLNGRGGISTSSEYGSTSPKYVYDNLISRYPNVKMVFSGHVGTGTSRTDTGVNGNKIVSYLGAWHSSTTNPLRLVEIDTRTDTVTTRVYSPNNNQTMTPNQTITGLTFD